MHPHPITHPDVALENYPDIAAFQPRKREMYEAVTESGEVASQSSNQVNVGKQTTSTDSTEGYDLDMGYTKHRGGSGGASVLWGLVEAEGSGEKTDTVNRQVGDINRNTLQDQHIQSTDTGREKRESYSHSTTLNHVYSLLQGYHLGTNRAVFFMQPRPHVQNAKFTFIRGLRALEGVQEFFLIVNRPADVPRLCVEIALETAHMRLARAYQPRLIPLAISYSGSTDCTAGALGLDLADFAWWRDLLDWNLWFPASRLQFNECARGERDATDVSGATVNQVAMMLQVIEMLPDIGVEDVALIFEEYEHHDDGEFFVAGRRLGACMAPIPPPGGTGGTLTTETSVPENSSHFDDPRGASIVYEGRLAQHVDGSTRRGGVDQPAGQDANPCRPRSNQALFDSLGSPARLAYGQVGPVESEAVLDELARFVRILGKSGVTDRPIDDVPALYKRREGLARLRRCRTAIDVGRCTTEEIAHGFGVSTAEAKRIRLGGADRRPREPRSRFDSSRDIARVNPVRDRLDARYPGGRLKELERSAGVVERGARERGGPGYGRATDGAD